MNALDQKPAPRFGRDSGRDGLHHLYCCNRDISLCGMDISILHEHEIIPEEQECVVCYTLDDADADCEDCK